MYVYAGAGCRHVTTLLMYSSANTQATWIHLCVNESMLDWHLAYSDYS